MLKKKRTLGIILSVCLLLVWVGFSVFSNLSYAQAKEKININTADAATLAKLSGIGEAKAKAIMKYREEKGNFKTIDELTKVKGISDKMFQKIKDEITVGEAKK